jgi:hypothetical protein
VGSVIVAPAVVASAAHEIDCVALIALSFVRLVPQAVSVSRDQIVAIINRLVDIVHPEHALWLHSRQTN